MISKNIYTYRKYFMVLSLLALLALGSIQPMQSADQIRIENEPPKSNIATEDETKILFVMDNDYGANYHFIRPIIESFGWNVTTTALSNVITPCVFQNEERDLEMDILLTDINDITEFDAISIMPGRTHTQLLASTDTLNLVKEAAGQGLVVSSWCRAIRILAKADVIDGKNVTGHDDYQAEVEAAGATFFSQVPPIIDGNIVTGVRSSFYRMEMCIAIATALGVYETNSPTINNITVEPTTPEPEQPFSVTLTASDDTGIDRIDLKIYRLDETNSRISSTPIITGELEDLDGDGLYNYTIPGMEEGRYTIDIQSKDVFSNENTTTGAMSLYVGYPPFITPEIGLAIVGVITVGIVVVAVFKRR